jgi:hypothetical protein
MLQTNYMCCISFDSVFGSSIVWSREALVGLFVILHHLSPSHHDYYTGLLYGIRALGFMGVMVQPNCVPL